MGKPVVGAIGLGLLGSALTATLLEHGFEVHGHDIDPQRLREHEQRGGVAAGSVREAVEGADQVLLCLLTSEIGSRVCFGPGGIAEVAASGLLVMDATTARPSDSIAIANGLVAHGIDYLDTAVSGSSAMAWQRDIVLMVGGPAEALERARPTLQVLGRSVHHLGGHGMGSRAKLIVNLVLGAHRLVLAEALVLGERSGVDLPKLLEVLRDGAAYSKAMDVWGERMVVGDHGNPASRIRQHAKDVRLMLEEGREAGAPLWVAETVNRALVVTEALGLSDADNSAVAETLRRLAAELPQAGSGGGAAGGDA